MFRTEFYEELGKFLYALALSDGCIHPKEIKMMEKLVQEELDSLHQQNEHPEYKEITLSKLSFYNCIRENISGRAARQSFLNYIQKHSANIDSHQRSIAARLIRRIAHAYKGENEAEIKLEKEVKDYFGNFGV